MTQDSSSSTEFFSSDVEADPPRRQESRYATVLSTLLILAVRAYQVSPLGWFLGGSCRFEPSCSHYFIGAIRKHGPWRGACKGIWRICRCQPFCRGGVDLP